MSRPHSTLASFKVPTIAAAFLLVAASVLPASELRFTPAVRAVQGARPSIVNIHGRKTVRSTDGQLGISDSMRQVNGMGTGVVIDERGYIITNNHVIDGVAKIQVTLANKKTYVGKLIAHDPKTDLAIIKIAAGKKLPVITIGRSSDLMNAEPVIAVGNAYGYHHTNTRGIISALDRTVQVSEEQTYVDLIQTDASINPGNSGGPLLNIDGEMIGLNVAVRVGAQGIGFAIPVDVVMEVAARLLSAEHLGKVSHGVRGTTVTEGLEPEFVVKSIVGGSPADNAGMKAGDVITAAASQNIERGLDFERVMLSRKPGDEVPLTIQRGNEEISLTLQLAAGGPTGEPQSGAWQVLGLKLAPIDSDEFQRYRTRYRGGMKVVNVRSGSPAQATGIQQGDVLVGILGWETISRENITYILKSKELKSEPRAKFYIVRGSETLFGHIQVR
jgi:serine protease Do